MIEHWTTTTDPLNHEEMVERLEPSFKEIAQQIVAPAHQMRRLDPEAFDDWVEAIEMFIRKLWICGVETGVIHNKAMLRIAITNIFEGKLNEQAERTAGSEGNDTD